MNKYKKDMIYHISSIVFTSLFMIISTYVWFYVKDFSIYNDIQDNKIKVSNEISFKSLNKIDNNNIDSLNSYVFDVLNETLETQEFKISIVPDLLTNNVSNNYIKYQINGDTIRSLNMDGIIYIDNIEEQETKNIDLKIWISDTYEGDLNFNGRVIVS